MKTLLLFLITATTTSQLAAAVEIYFTPGPDCENKIVTAIGEAKEDVSAAV